MNWLSRLHTTQPVAQAVGVLALVCVAGMAFEQRAYPPDKQEKATQTVLQQAELLCADWAW